MRTGFALFIACFAAAGYAPMCSADGVRPGEKRTRSDHGIEWTEQLVRSSVSSRCGDPETQCVDWQVFIGNPGKWELACMASIRYPQPNAHRIPDALQNESYVGPNTTKVVLGSPAPLDQSVESIESSCLLVPPEPAHPTAFAPNNPLCRYTTVEGVSVDDFYPPAAKAEHRQGTVVVEFTLSSTPGPPTELHIAQSSGFEDLDAAAATALSNSKMDTICSGNRFKVAVKFRLPKQASAQ